MPNISNTDADRRLMLDKIGAKTFEELLDRIPEDLRLKRELNIPALSEMELLRELQTLANKNTTGMACFAGGGVYDHYIPSAVAAIVSRPEFATAYTPYQAEVAQGTLQVTYEFQSHICRLTGMEVANASMYDGATATAEAAAMSMGVTRRFKVVMSESVNPLYRQVIETYLIPRDVELVTVPMAAGRTDLDRLKTVVDDKTSCVILGQPNFFGLIEEASDVADIIHAVGGHCIMTVDPIAQAILKTPADCGADIVTGEGQPMGIPLSYGGPLVGFLAATKKLIRNMPGRIVARTHDVDGNPGFVLTLQTREQHIRRDKATSNICTSQALCATMAAVHMTLLGRTGLKRVALLSAEKAQKAAAALCALEGFEPYFEGPFVREFAIRTPKPAGDMIQALTANGILAGIDAGRWYEGMDDCLVVALTEKRTDADIEALVRGLEELAASGILSRM